MDFDDVLKHVGEWGKYQTTFYLMVSLPILFKGFQVMLVVFTVFVPKHRCALPGWSNDSYYPDDEAHRQIILSTIPYSMKAGEVLFDQCHLYADYNISFNNATDLQNRSLTACSRWVYDQSELDATLISKFDLVCDRKGLRAHSSMMMMAGFLAGSTIASVLCDWLGRKRIYYGCLVVTIAFGVASAFPTSPEMLLVFRFLSGLGLMGLMVSGFVLAVEVIGGSMRTKMGAAWQIVWLAGPFLLAGLSYFLRDWRQLQLAGSVPTLIFLIYWWLVPESPRWLVTKGRIPEAMVTIRKMANVNGKVLLSSVERQLEDGRGQRGQDAAVSPLVIFKYPPLFVRFFIVVFNWAVISMTYYGLSLNVANLSGGVRINFILSCVVELIGCVAAVVLLDRFGRKRVHAASMLMAGAACLLSIFPVLFAEQDQQWITTVLAMIGKLGVSSSFAVIYLYSAELYPTVLRNFGVGCGSMFARMGSMVSPYVADLAIYIEGVMGTAVPLIIFGGLAVAAGLSSLLLPETLHRKLPETVSDAVNFGKNSGKVHEAGETSVGPPSLEKDAGGLPLSPVQQKEQ